jgi:trehalose-phosphatase
MTTFGLMESLPEIARRIDQAKSILLGLDFDGTLVPIRSHPDEVTLAEPVRSVLTRLARMPRVTLMIVSGRGRADVAGRVGLSDIIYAGNHGLEIQGPGIAFLEPMAAALASSLAELTKPLVELLTEIPGALVEPKGLTTSVHYRNVANDRWDEVTHAVQEVVALDPERFVLNSGHQVWEIRPIVAWHKGEAINWVIQHLEDPSHRLVFYLGDDRTDEDAFACLPDGVTVKIGRGQTSTLARYQLANPDSVERFLTWLADKLRHGWLTNNYENME